MTAQEFYKGKAEQLRKQQTILLRRKSNFAWLRLANIVAVGAALYFLYPYGWLVAIAVSLVLAIIFVQLIFRDLANSASLAHHAKLIQINDDEIKATNGQYYQFPGGTEHIPKDHYYANDMDIFGHASLFQYLNRTVSEMGSVTLAGWLLAPANAPEILNRQEAIKELSTKITWGQHLQGYGKENPVTIRTKDRLQHWVTEPADFSRFKAWQWLRYLLPLISVSVTLAVIFTPLPMNIFYLTMFIMVLAAFPQEKKVGHLHNRLSKMVDELDTLSQSIATIEQESFASPMLKELQAHYKHQHTTASKQISKLKKILDRLDLRFNIVLAPPLNLLLLWNIQQMLELERWKKNNDADVALWFDTLGSYEALLSLAVIHFNNPAWVFPVLKEEHFFMEASDLGHPLIAEKKRVNNFVSITQKASVMLVTGSNMAGKSTYLRSAGINVILAMAGAPVCATRFELSPVQLISSMRISDNLEESTSTFYAELKKLKTVIEKVNANEKVFILLDEILRGTNSLDRHTGSEALIKQLIKQDAAAILATHDLDLATLQDAYPQNIFNYHFDVQVENQELYFDYRLKPGVCTSLNASILMKKIGLEL